MTPAQLARRILENAKRPRSRPRLGQVVHECPKHGVRMRAGSSTALVTFYYCPVCRALGTSRQKKVPRPA